MSAGRRRGGDTAPTDAKRPKRERERTGEVSGDSSGSVGPVSSSKVSSSMVASTVEPKQTLFGSLVTAPLQAVADLFAVTRADAALPCDAAEVLVPRAKRPPVRQESHRRARGRRFKEALLPRDDAEKEDEKRDPLRAQRTLFVGNLVPTVKAKVSFSFFFVLYSLFSALCANCALSLSLISDLQSLISDL